MARPKTYVRQCGEPSCGNWLTKTDVITNRLCPTCRQRNWNGQKIHSNRLWGERDRICRLRAQRGAGVAWYVRCTFPGCDNEVRWLSKSENKFCKKHCLESQRKPFFRSFRSMAALAAGRGLTFAISYEQYVNLIGGAKCAYCLKLLEIREQRSSSDERRNTFGLDRVDTSRGYMPGNVVPACGACNVKKGWRFCAADMFADRAAPENWPADSFEMTATHRKYIADTERLRKSKAAAARASLAKKREIVD